MRESRNRKRLDPEVEKTIHLFLCVYTLYLAVHAYHHSKAHWLEKERGGGGGGGRRRVPFAPEGREGREEGGDHTLHYV